MKTLRKSRIEKQKKIVDYENELNEALSLSHIASMSKFILLVFINHFRLCGILHDFHVISDLQIISL